MIIGNAEYVSADDSQPWLVGEDENGDWWVPYRMCDVPQRGRWKPGRWRRFNRRCLLDWLHYWNSRRRNQVVFLFGSTPNSVPREDRHGS